MYINKETKKHKNYTDLFGYVNYEVFSNTIYNEGYVIRKVLESFQRYFTSLSQHDTVINDRTVEYITSSLNILPRIINV